MEEWKDNISETSKMSSHSHCSTATSAQTRAAIRRAKLMCQQAALKKRQQLEEEELKLHQQKEKLLLDTELQIEEAKMAILDKEKETRSDVSLHLSEEQRQPSESVKSWLMQKEEPPQLDPKVNPWNGALERGKVVDAALNRLSLQAGLGTEVLQEPQLEVLQPLEMTSQEGRPTDGNQIKLTAPLNITTHKSTNQESQKSTANPVAMNNVVDLIKEQGNLTKLLLEQQLRATLPQRSITPFSGDALEYISFIRAFEYTIDSKTSNEKDRLYYLEQYTVNDANKLVKSCMHMEDGYSKAKALLKKKFGNRHKVAEAFVKKTISWPDIKAEDTRGLSSFSLFLIECRNTLTDLDYSAELDHSANIKATVAKLPYRLRERWRSRVDQIMEVEGHVVKFNHLVNFIEKQARIASNSVYGDVASARDSSRNFNRNSKEFKGSTKSSSFATNVSPRDQKKPNESSDSKDYPCMFCDGKGHSLDVCRKLQSKTNEDKIDFLKAKGICFGCLKKSSHISKDCSNRLKCDRCGGRHPTILHRQFKAPHKNSETTGPDTVTSAGSRCELTGAGTPAIVPVKVHSRQTGRSLITYAFLDDGSNAVFCSEKLKSQLGVRGRNTKLQIQTLLEDQQVDSCVLDDIEISDLEGRNIITLPDVYTQTKMPVSIEDVVTTHDLAQWSYLRSVELPDISKEAVEVGLLIGSNVPKATEPWEVVHSQDGGPYAYRTLLGWVVCGLTSKTTTNLHVSANRILVKRTSIEKQLADLYNYEFTERLLDDQPEKSREDQQFVDFVKKNTRHVDGHFVIGMPLRSEDTEFPNNMLLAEKRASYLMRRFLKDDNFKEDYVTAMNTTLEKGYAERVPESERGRNDGKVWYIPHHGVRHPQKKKLRVVYDCAASYKSVSLNQELLQGPDLTNSLIGVLLRFRKENVALMADIEAMFHQVKVPRADRDLLRFLWWPDGNLNMPLEEYRMTAHIFGAKSSPACANYALQRTADGLDGEVRDTIEKNFYVDDCLRSIPTETSAVTLAKDLQLACKKGGFNLTKWMSNRRTVLESIPENDRAKDVKNLDLGKDTLPVERALGMIWNVEHDTFGCKVEIKPHPLSRRGILSVVSAIYDPLGFVGAAMLPARRILQDLCRLELGWDDSLPEKHSKEWQKWLSEIHQLKEFNLSRCFKPHDFGLVTSSQLHHFADASEVGYGTVSYLRSVNNRGDIHCSLVMGKSRVAPLKKITIPRMELTAATVAVRVNKMLQRELNLQCESCFWTDSTSVLCYIANRTTRFHTFVANRLAVIREGSRVEQWRHVKTDLNPADECSRGQSVADFLKNKRWTRGPDFLWKPETEWPASSSYTQLGQNDPEVKKVTVNAVCVKEAEDTIDRLMEHYSSWHRLKKGVAWILKVRRHLLLKSREKKIKNATTVPSRINKQEDTLEDYRPTSTRG